MMKIVISLCLYTCFLQTIVYAQMQSVYSKIGYEDCKRTTFKDGGYSSSRSCGSYAGITISLIYSDAREDMHLIRAGKTYNLQFMGKVWSSFSNFGKVMEWRYDSAQKNNPHAMIVRYSCGGYDEEGRNTETPRLVVSKITKDTICIVGWIDPSKNQNKKAREMADRASSMPCLKDRRY